MGSPKALLPLSKETALERSVNLFANAGIQDIRVVTGHLAETVRGRLPNLPVRWIHNDVYQRGMLSSIQKGISSIGEEHAWFFLLPVDIPLVRPQTLSLLLEARQSPGRGISIIHPAFMGRRGHPPLISTGLTADILALDDPAGLDGFLARHHTDAVEIPVIDEFIERDMDTPADYRSLSTALSKYHMPTPAECEALLTDTSLFPQKTAAHCRQVARLATYLGESLADCNVPIDLWRVASGALLHDIAKREKKHAAAGAALLRKMGYSGIADIVSSHVDIDVSEASTPPTEAEVVYLADKLVQGDIPVSLSGRFEHKLAKYGHDPSARAAILKRRTDAEAIAKRIERAVGNSFESIMAEYSKDSE